MQIERYRSWYRSLYVACPPLCVLNEINKISHPLLWIYPINNNRRKSSLFLFSTVSSVVTGPRRRQSRFHLQYPLPGIVEILHIFCSILLATTNVEASCFGSPPRFAGHARLYPRPSRLRSPSILPWISCTWEICPGPVDRSDNRLGHLHLLLFAAGTFVLIAIFVKDLLKLSISRMGGTWSGLTA